MDSFKCTFLLIIAFYSCCTLCSGYTINQLSGTWIVRNSSEIGEFEKCPFIRIEKVPNSNNATIEYKSEDVQFNLTVKSLTTTPIQLIGSNGTKGNLTILKSDFPFYMMIRIYVPSEDDKTFMVLTRRYNLSREMDVEIMKFWNTTSETKSIPLYSTDQATPKCQKFLGKYDSEAKSPYPEIVEEPITVQPTTTEPPKPTTTKKPNGSSRIVSDMVLITFLICLIKY